MSQTCLYRCIACFAIVATTTAHSKEMKCIAAPTSTAKDVKAEIAAKVDNLKGVVNSAGFSAQAGVITNDLYSKYPNSDRLIVAQAMLSQVCSLLNSVSISDEAKVLKYSETEMLVFRLASGAPSSASSSSSASKK